MRPINLKITGINSFNKTQEIDFDDLTKDGIFGIVGDTGAGKSSIIDCITLALYGKVSRYDNDNDKKDFLHINCKENAEVEFTFGIRDNRGEHIYKVKRRFNRNKEGGITSKSIELSELDINDNKYNIKESSVKAVTNMLEEIIGLKYKDFIKTVVIPQGRFNEFLSAKNKDKRDTLESIFSLEEYGDNLNKKVNGKRKFIFGKLGSLNEALQSHIKDNIEETGGKDIDNIEKTDKIVRAIENKKRELVDKEEELLDNIKLSDELEKARNKNDADIVVYEEIKEFKEEYSKAKNKTQELLEGEKDYLENEDKLAKAKVVDDIYVEILKKERLYEQVENSMKEFENKKEESITSSNKLDDAKKKSENIKDEKEKENPKLKEEVNKLNDIKKNLEKRIELEKNISKAEQDLEKINGQEEDINKDLNNLAKEKKGIEALNKKLDNFNNDNNFSNNNGLIYGLNSEINKIINNSNINLGSCDLNDDDINLYYIENLGLDVLIICKESLVKDINRLEQKIFELKSENANININLEKLKENLTTNQNEKIIQDLASGLLDTLKENTKCPLCGSEAPYPEILEPNYELDSIIARTKENIKLNDEAFKKNNNSISKIENDIFLKNGKIKELEEGLLKGIGKRADVISREDLVNRCGYFRAIYDELEKKIKTNIFEINNDNKSKLVILSSDIDKKNSTKNQNNESKGRLNGIIEYNINELERIISELDGDKKDLKLDEIKEKIKYKNEIISENEKKYEDSLKILEDLNEKNNDINLKLKGASTTYRLDYKSLEEQKDNILNLINKNNMAEDTLKNYYMDDQQKKDYENKIEKYKGDNLIYKNKLNELDIKAIKISEKSGKNVEDIKDFSDEVMENIKNHIEELNMSKIKIEETSKDKFTRKGHLEATIKDLTKLLVKIDKIYEDIKVHRKEYDILNDISKILKGGAFLDYIAELYLEPIVRETNRRLLDITQSKYEIKLIEGGFVIKDWSNGGAQRSTASLSGGETFIVSLCLSLGLLTMTQLRNKSPLEVFFLDEGFGMLDNNTLDAVMNSIEKLKKENLNVGIITHVEEIKNRISNKIVITGSEYGSIIRIE